MPFVYSFVSRGNVVLADYTAYSGNVNTVALQLLEKCPADNNKCTFTWNKHTFNYLQDSGYSCVEVLVGCIPQCMPSLGLLSSPTAFMVVADEDMGRQLPYALLERIKDEFLRTYNDRGKIATAHSLDKAFG